MFLLSDFIVGKASLYHVPDEIIFSLGDFIVGSWRELASIIFYDAYGYLRSACMLWLSLVPK